jgi:hypothetical protein
MLPLRFRQSAKHELDEKRDEETSYGVLKSEEPAMYLNWYSWSSGQESKQVPSNCEA